MCEHIAHAAANNQLISWLQYTLTCGHYQVAQVWQFGFQPAICWKHCTTTLSDLLSCCGQVLVVFLISCLVYIGATDSTRPIFVCTKVLLFLFLTESNLWLIGMRPVLLWDCTECRVVIPEERGAHSLHSGSPEMMRGRSEGVNKYEKGLNCIPQIDFNTLGTGHLNC
jgi:hypothetical protein